MPNSQRRYRNDQIGTQAPTNTNPKTHSKARTKMRKKLRKRGISEEVIADVIERMQFEQDCARLGLEAARQLRYDRIKEPDDKGYKPTRYDSLLHGVGRVTGDTAKAVKSKKAIVR